MSTNSNEIPQVLSYGCPYGAVQAIWAQDAQLISIDIIEGVVTLADTKSRDFWQGGVIAVPIIADATGQGGNPARDASRSPKDFPNGLTTMARIAARYQTVTETQSPAAVENKIGQNSQSREK